MARIFVAGSLLTGTGAAAASFTVTNTNDSGPGSLRQAFADADMAADEDTIVFDLPAGAERVIRVTTSLGASTNLTVLNDRAGDVPVTIEVVANGFVNYSCFVGGSTGRLVLSGLTLRGARASGVRGGGEYLVLRNCTITGNTGVLGGGVFGGANVLLANCLIAGNRASQGGGIYNGGRLTLQNCTISDNTSETTGGGIQNWEGGQLTMVDCKVSGNSTTSTFGGTRGGGGLNNIGLLGMTNCTFSDNRVVNFGVGGVFTTGAMVANSCTFLSNQGETAGALYDYGSKRQSYLNNCTFSGNSTLPDSAQWTVVADFRYVNGNPKPNPKLWISNCTFAQNPKSALLVSGGSNTKVDVTNTIFKRGGNSANLVVFNDPIGGTNTLFTSRGHNLSDDAAGGDGNAGAGGYLNGPGDIRNTDPLLGPLGDNGGATMTHALLPGSPAIDAGDNSTATPRDQRNLVRSGTRDIGSFELNGTVSTTRLANISTRARCLTNDNVLIAGFIITGQDNKKVIVRAIGPSLAGSTHLNNPTVQLYDGAGQVIASNDNWNDAPNRQEIIDSTVAPTNDLESAILMTLPPGAYTAVVRGAANSTGIAVVEAYDLDPAANSRFANISTRSLVQTGENVMIGGVIVVGPDNQTVVVRALGPSLPVTKPLADPELELFDSNGTLLAYSYNWYDNFDPSVYENGSDVKVVASGLPPAKSLECALVITLPAGQYTAIVSGFEQSIGVGLVEVYALP